MKCGKADPSGLKPLVMQTGQRLNYGIAISSTMYSPQLLDHFEHPRNAGELADADARVRVENPACGDILELAVKVEGNCIQPDSISCQGMCSGDGVRLANYGDGGREEHVAAGAIAFEKKRLSAVDWRAS